MKSGRRLQLRVLWPAVVVAGILSAMSYAKEAKSQLLGKPPAKTPSKESSEKDRNYGLLRELLQSALHDFVKGENSVSRISLVSRVAMLQAELGDVDEAQGTFRRVKEFIEAEPERRQVELKVTYLARRFGELGNVEEVRKVLESLSYRPGLVYENGYDDRDMQIYMTAGELALAGKINEALQLAQGIQAKGKVLKPFDPQMVREGVRNDYLKLGARYFTEAGNIKEALRIVDSMSDAAKIVEVLVGALADLPYYGELPDSPVIALGQEQTGDHAGATRTLERALKIAREIQEAKQGAGALAAVANVQARVGDFAAARRTLSEISRDSSYYDYAVVAIAKAQAAAGQGKAAVEAVTKIRPLSIRAYGLYQVGIGQARAGNPDDARASFEESRALLKGIAERERGQALSHLACARAIARDFKGAMETAAEASRAPYAVIAREQAKAGDVAGALQTVRKNLLQRGDILRTIARIQAQRGDEKDALVWARQLTSPRERGCALLGAAEGVGLRCKIFAPRPY